MISIIVPIYNAAAYLDECLGSIAAQTHQDWEAILVDDGSTDNSAEIAQRHCERDNRFRLLREKNAGPSAARNLGIDHAQGDWLMFVDADDMLHPDSLAVMLVNAQTAHAQVSVVDYGRTLDSLRSVPASQVITGRQAILRTLYQDKFNSGPWGKLFDRHLFDNLRFRQGIIYEDLDIIYRLYELAHRVAWTEAKLYFYRDNQSSFMNTFKANRLDVLKVVDAIEDFYSSDIEMLQAAHDRKFAANYNMYLLCGMHKQFPEQRRRCLSVVKAYRKEILFNPQSRIKNKLGALLSYLL